MFGNRTISSGLSLKPGVQQSWESNSEAFYSESQLHNSGNTTVKSPHFSFCGSLCESYDESVCL